VLQDSLGRNHLIRLTQLAVAGALLLALIAPVAQAASYPTGFEERTVVGGLTVPTAMAWAPDGRLFVIEKPGRLKVVAPGGTTATTILDISSQVNDFHDRGLLGLAVDSSFASNGYVYLLYTYDVRPMTQDSDAPMVSRLERYTVSPTNVVASRRVLLGSYTSGACPAPSNRVDCIPSDDTSHSIGTVRSAPDGTLWVGSGDAASFTFVDPRAFRTYDERSMAGKIMHVDRNGRGLPGHPFCPLDANLDHVCSKVWAGGFRNPFRFKLRPGGGLTVGDVGWGTREELDLIPTGSGGGRLYGWPCYEGSAHTGGYLDRDECGAEYAKEGTANAHVPPDYEYPRAGASAAVLGGPTYTGDEYPADYHGDVFFGDYALGFIKKANLDAQGRIASVDNFASGWSGVDLEPTPNGELAYASFGDGSSASGSIRRVVYSPPNRSPVAVASAPLTSGRAPFEVSFTGSSSSDADGDPLTYDWDFGDGSAHSSQPNPTHTYSVEGVFTSRLTVSDGRGLSDTDTITISVGGSPPVASTPPSAAVPAPNGGTGMVAPNKTAQPRPAGLVAAYGFEEGAGRSVGDASGRGNRGTISGAAWTAAGKHGKALSFDGVNDWVTAADSASLDLRRAMTLSAWVKPDVPSRPWQTLIAKESAGFLSYALYASGEVPRSNGWWGDSALYAPRGRTLRAHAWTHVALTSAGGTMRLYLNGRRVRSKRIRGILRPSAGALRIAGNAVWRGRFFDGVLDDVRIYNRALTAAKVRADRRTPVVRPAHHAGA
jgi:glucose/arabinose dehydrogenase